MFYEDLSLRNISILQRLSDGNASLEELANSGKCKIGQISSSLNQLSKQGLISERNGIYQLSPESEQMTRLLKLMKEWTHHFDGTFYEIAKDAAQAILTKSWNDVGVKDVLLYGSTLKVPNPRDIDMVVLHNGNTLMEFSPYAKSAKYDVAPATIEDTRASAFSILKKIGYKSDEFDSVAKAVGKRIENLGAGTIPQEEIEEEVKKYNEWGWDPEMWLDIHGINNIFDIHVLNTDLLSNLENFTIKERRQNVIKSCGDPTYWYTVLSEGRLYDITKHDFTLKVDDKYPGAVKLFPSK